MNSKRKFSAQSTASLIKKARQYEKARAAPSLQRAVAAAVRKTVEKKGVDFPINTTEIVSTVNSNQAAFCLNLIQQGVGSWNRVGRKIQLQSIRLRGQLEWTLDAATSTANYVGNCVRMVVVWDTQPSDTAIPSFEQVFGVTGQDGSETCTYLNPVRYDNMDRFSVLSDTVMKLKPPICNTVSGSTSAVQVIEPFDKFVKLSGKFSNYSGNSNPMTMAGLSSGGLYVYFRAAQNTVDTNRVAVGLDSFARLRYIDP